jgi:hypothetical protein
MSAAKSLGFIFFSYSLFAGSSRYPALPLSVPNPEPPIITQIVTVSQGEDLQAVLSGAVPGTNIVCAGLFVGNFYIPGVANVELSGTCNIQSPNTSPAFMNISATEGFGWTGNVSDRAAQNWWITGITISTQGPVYHAVVIENDCDPNPAGTPSGITFSGVTVNGLYMQDGQQNGMLLDGENISLLDSQVTGWQSSGILSTEANAVEIICGTGPYLFHGNTLSGSSEDFFIGAPGDSPTVPSSQIIPSDITFSNNLLTKNLAWIGTAYAADKNCWESKDSERVLISGNLIENCYPGGQSGEGILLTPRIGLGDPVQYFSQVSDTTITGNTIQAGVGVSVSGMDNYCTVADACVYSARTLVSGNSVNVSIAPNGVPGSYGWCVQIDIAQELTVNRMNCTTNGAQSLFVDTAPCTSCAVANSSFNADFGGQGIVGPAAFFQGAGANNSISNVAVSGITPAAFQSEWLPYCSNCTLKQ